MPVLRNLLSLAALALASASAQTLSLSPLRTTDALGTYTQSSAELQYAVDAQLSMPKEWQAIGRTGYMIVNCMVSADGTITPATHIEAFPVTASEREALAAGAIALLHEIHRQVRAIPISC